MYRPCGQGEHIYFGIRKRDLSTLEALEQIARHLGCQRGDFGYAGLKDRKGVTQQTLSIAGVDQGAVEALDIPKIELLWVTRHQNKLRVGHLFGNRFSIRIRGIDTGAVEQVAPIVESIRKLGLPNYYGPQRFGNRGDAQWIGAALLGGDHRAGLRRILGAPSPMEGNPRVVQARWYFEQFRWVDALDTYPLGYRDERRLLRYLLRHGEKYRGAVKQLRSEILRLYFSALQSFLFNEILELRLGRSGDPGELLDGDVAYQHHNGSVFRVDSAEELRERLERFEISPSGAIFGIKTVQTEKVPYAVETAVLDAHGLRSSDFHQLVQRCRLEGGRRPLRVPVRDLEWRVEEDDGSGERSVVFDFFLPKGSYATTFLREIMKNDIVPPAYAPPRTAEGDEVRWIERDEPPVVWAESGELAGGDESGNMEGASREPE